MSILCVFMGMDYTCVCVSIVKIESILLFCLKKPLKSITYAKYHAPILHAK